MIEVHMTIEVVVFLVSIVAVALLIILFRTHKALRSVRRKYEPIIELDAEIQKRTSERDSAIKETEVLREEYTNKRQIFDKLKGEVALYEDKMAFIEMGVYEPHFDFSDPEEYKDEIKWVRAEQKAMVKDKTAVICTTQWQVEGSVAKGRTMTNRNIRLTLRAFNGECDVAIANTRWNNAVAMEKRIRRAAEQIDKMNKSNTIFIEDDYVDLKIRELRLTHEYRERQQEEKERRREQARLEREEKKLIEEAKQAAREEEAKRKLLEKARADAEKDAQNAELQERVAQLERDLEDAHAKTERAKSMAEQTRIGHVYVVSNIGSFGENVVKIGMTRRVNPDDRIKELGDASVPFIFDTHAMIYTEDAPAMETELHKRFHARRVNAVNMRKEFFRVSLEEVAAAIRELDPNASFAMDVEAREYMETIAFYERENQDTKIELEAEFPLSI